LEIFDEVYFGGEEEVVDGVGFFYFFVEDFGSAAEGEDYFVAGDVGGLFCEGVAAFFSAVTFYDAVFFEGVEDLFEEVEGDGLSFGDYFHVEGALLGVFCKFEESLQAVIYFDGEFHFSASLYGCFFEILSM